jgi:DNA modification methylase
MATASHTKVSRPLKTKAPRYRPILDLPPLPPEQYEALRDNIALNGVVVPILVDGDGPVRGVIDGNHRKRIADELGCDCPEMTRDGLSYQEKRTLARALNLARRQLDQAAKRAIIADQLRETPGRSNRWVARQLGVHHATVACVRADLEGTGQIIQFDRTVGADGKARPASRAGGDDALDGERGRADDPPETADRRIKYNPKPSPLAHRTRAEHRARIEATTLLHGDCRVRLKSIPSASVDAVIADPIYPEVRREYGRITEAQWHDLMAIVVAECRRIYKPAGSAVFIIQPNYERLGRMRLWPWEFIVRAGREWNLVEDAYWWAIDAMPLAGTDRKVGLLRQSVKLCVWLGPPDCYRNQDNVLWTPSEATSARRRSDLALRTGRNNRNFRNGTIAGVADERGGTTPFNLLPAPVGPQPGGAEDHPSTTPYDVADWWCRYILPPGGVLLDPFCGSGTMLMAGLDRGASKVIGIDTEAKYLETTRRRIESA